MESLEVYESARGEVFEISAQELEPLGDHRRLLFKIVPSSDRENSWTYIAQASRILLKTHENLGSSYELHTALGTLKIERAIDAGEMQQAMDARECLQIFKFNSYVRTASEFMTTSPPAKC